MKYAIYEIATVVGADTGRLADPDAVVSLLLTDSRSLTYARETLFFALRTHNADGHHYVQALYEKGVRNFVVESDEAFDATTMRDANFLVVNDTLEALQTLATHHRRRFRWPGTRRSPQELLQRSFGNCRRSCSRGALRVPCTQDPKR